jgi:phosphoglycolate phosphatase-like HAD superfamily hydrolase
MPDDMVAAARSRFGFKGVGFLAQSSNKDILKGNLLRAGADYIIEDFEEIREILYASEI